MTLTPNEWPGALKRLVELWAEHGGKKRGRTVRPGGLAQRVLSPAYGRFYHSLSVGRSMTSRTAERVWRTVGAVAGGPGLAASHPTLERTGERW